MFISLLPVPFADAARQQQFDALEAALQAEADAPASVLLGNLGAFAGFDADALLVRAHCLALLVLTPRAGRLTMPALAYGSWQLDGQLLAGRMGSDNPFVQYQQQQPDALAWLQSQVGQALPPCAGLALFEAPLTFGPEVEAHLHHDAGHDFQLVGGVAQLLRRLPQLAAPTAVLTETALLAWASQLEAELATPWQTEPELPTNYLTQKLQQLWRWLGAEDIPADLPYGAVPTPDLHLRDQQEQARLQHLRQELQAELHHQRQEAAAREAARTQELAQLRQQLAQAGQSTTERQAEQQAKAALEEELRTTRAELATRHQELDTRIQQLGLLIKQLQATDKPPQLSAQPQPASPSRPALVAAAERLPSRSAPVAWPAATAAQRRLRQAERWGVVALVAAGLSVGAWGVARLARQPKSRPATAHRRSRVFQQEEAVAPRPVYIIDSTLATPTLRVDTAGTARSATVADPDEELPAQASSTSAKQPADSTTVPAAASPTPTTAPDSAAVPSPTP
ncbi:MAG: hypothetical protein ACRYG7_21875 [Janthinobacterium lividum]